NAAPPPPAVRCLPPEFGQFGSVRKGSCQCLESQSPDIRRQARYRLFRAVVRADRFATGTLSGSQGSSGHCRLSVGSFPGVRVVDGADQNLTDEVFTLFHGGIVQVVGEVCGGVVVEWTVVPGTHGSPSAVRTGSSHRLLTTECVPSTSVGE